MKNILVRPCTTFDIRIFFFPYLVLFSNVFVVPIFGNSVHNASNSVCRFQRVLAKKCVCSGHVDNGTTLWMVGHASVDEVDRKVERAQRIQRAAKNILN